METIEFALNQIVLETLTKSFKLCSGLKAGGSALITGAHNKVRTDFGEKSI